MAVLIMLSVLVVDRRDYAGYENTFSTMPSSLGPIAAFGGAALINNKGKLVGIGSLLVQTQLKKGSVVPGNMFIPIDSLKAFLEI